MAIMPKDIAPYVVGLLVAALLARRVLKAQQPQRVKMARLWILPAILVVAMVLSMANEPVPGMLAVGAFLVAAAAGAALGWFRVHTLEFSIDPETGAISTKSTPVGAFLLVGLLGFRYALKYVLHEQGVSGVNLVRWTDGAMIFTVSMLIAQSTHTWVRARKLLPSPVAAPISGPTE